MIEALVLVTVLVPMVAGGGAWFAGPRAAWRMVAVGLAAAIVAGLALAAIVFTSGAARGFGGLVAIDALGAYMLVLVLVVAAIGLAGSPGHLVHDPVVTSPEPHDHGRYYALFAWFAGGLAAVPLLDSLGLVWVAVEFTTIVSALLVGYARSRTAIEAAWKYLILGSIGIGFALLGTLLLYASSVGVLGETSDALSWTRLMDISDRLDPAFVRLAFVFALVGYGTKAGLAPFHTWLPDAHSQAPSPISAVLSGAALAVALYALARFNLVVAGATGPQFPSGLLVAFGLLSLAIALPFIVAQGDLKRLLAYSSIEHLGLATLALGFGGPLALLGFTLHLISHGLVKSTAFLAAGRLVAERGSRRIGRLSGSLGRSPADGAALLVATLLLAGLPPSGIFVAEVAIILGGFEQGWGLAAAAAGVLLALAVAGLLFHSVRISVQPGGRRGRARQAAVVPVAGGPGSSQHVAVADLAAVVGPAAVVPLQLAVAHPAAPAVPPQSAVPLHRRTLGLALLFVPLGVVVVLGLWTPPALRAILDQVVVVLGGGHG